jgi:hypothetical protein
MRNITLKTILSVLSLTLLFGCGTELKQESIEESLKEVENEIEIPENSVKVDLENSGYPITFYVPEIFKDVKIVSSHMVVADMPWTDRLKIKEQLPEKEGNEFAFQMCFGIADECLQLRSKDINPLVIYKYHFEKDSINGGCPEHVSYARGNCLACCWHKIYSNEEYFMPDSIYLRAFKQSLNYVDIDGNYYNLFNEVFSPKQTDWSEKERKYIRQDGDTVNLIKCSENIILFESISSKDNSTIVEFTIRFNVAGDFYIISSRDDRYGEATNSSDETGRSLTRTESEDLIDQILKSVNKLTDEEIEEIESKEAAEIKAKESEEAQRKADEEVRRERYSLQNYPVGTWVYTGQGITAKYILNSDGTYFYYSSLNTGGANSGTWEYRTYSLEIGFTLTGGFSGGVGKFNENTGNLEKGGMIYTKL